MKTDNNIVVIWPKAAVPPSISQTNQNAYSNLHVLSNSSVTFISEKTGKAQYFYPQPANDKLITSVKIFNILGKEVRSFILSESSIAIPNLPQGLYLVKIQTKNEGEKVQKLIIKR